MEPEAVAVIAAEETERREDASDTAVELARIEQENVETRAEADVAINAAHADAAVAIAEAQAEGNEEWRNEAAAIRAQLSEMAQTQATLAESIALMAQAQIAPPILTPPASLEEGDALAAPIIESDQVVIEAPRAPEAEAEKRRIRRLM